MNLQQKPTLINVIAWTTLASGVGNLFWGLAVSHTALATVIGFFCIPITILPTILGVFELIYAAKLFSNPPQEVKPSTNLAILEIVCVITGNVFSMAVGILSLVFYNDAVVKDYFARLNGLPVTVTPASQPEPAPVIDETVLSDSAESFEEHSGEETSPLDEESPSKPKRTLRKTTKS